MVFHDLWSSIPPITRSILLIQFFLSLSVTLELCTPFKLYFNFNLIKRKYQVSLPHLSIHITSVNYAQITRVFVVLEDFHLDVLLWGALSRGAHRHLHLLPVLKPAGAACIQEQACALHLVLHVLLHATTDPCGVYRKL